MGIKDLNKFINLNVPNAIQNWDLSKFKGKKVAIDTSIFLYKYLYKNQYYIEGFFQQIYRLINNGIIPIYVFDGTPPVEKNYVLKSRKQKRKNLDNKKNMLKLKYLDKINNSDIELNSILSEIKKIDKKNIKVTSDHIHKLKQLFDLMGIKYVHPNCEADTYCSALYQNNVVDMCMSDDMDLLTGGCNKLIRNFNISSNIVTFYNLDIILKELNINKDQWLDFCILCGCDYTKKIRGINYNNAYDLIKKYGSIEQIISNIENILDNPNIQDFDYISSRRIFNNYNFITIKLSKYQITIGYLWGNQFDQILSLLKKSTKLSEKQLQVRLKRIYKIK
jgi:flap endonuclease-1